ncbi:MAG: hypothetical protein IPG76_02475 [Acidobacteria bacterium]|nr:hypothetical protein [Acidobacteriota bacterium]
MPYKTVLILALIIAIPAQPTGRLETITRKLTSPEFDGRAFKSEGGLKAAQFIAENFKQIGLKPGSVKDGYLQKIASGGQNVIASIEGRDPGLKKNRSSSAPVTTPSAANLQGRWIMPRAWRSCLKSQERW